MTEVAHFEVPTTRRYPPVSPLRYPGGKASLAGVFQDLIRHLGSPVSTYVEPFAGGVGAGVALLSNDVVDRLVINDIDGAVYSFWRSVFEETDAFVELIEGTPLTIDEWRRQQVIYRAGDERNRLALGFAFFYLNRTNRSGVLHAGVIGGLAQAGKYKIDARFNRATLAKRIADLGALRDRVTVSDKDGAALIRTWAVRDDAFLYIDPPYVDMGGSLYLNAFTDREHVELSRVINDLPDANWLLTYDPAPLVRELYAGRAVREYRLGYSAYRRERASELMITSNPVTAALQALTRGEALDTLRAS